MKPCLVCGEPSDGPRCPEHPRGPRSGKSKTPNIVARNGTAWKNLSRRLRRLQPWCSVPGCGNTELTVDHIVPLVNGGAPFDLANLQVLCRSHNSAKGRGEGVTRSDPRSAGKAQPEMRMVPTEGVGS